MQSAEQLVARTVEVTPATLGTSGNVLSPATTKTTPQLVPVGFVMNVTPQVSDGDVVVLNVRPTVTSKVGDAKDPNPDLARVNQTNLVPIIRSREFESVLRIRKLLYDEGFTTRSHRILQPDACSAPGSSGAPMQAVRGPSRMSTLTTQTVIAPQNATGLSR